MIWVIILLAVPYLFLAIYLIYGPPGRAGFAKRRERSWAKLQALQAELLESLKPWTSEPSSADLTLERLAGFPPLKGNSVTLLAPGQVAFQAIFEAMDRACDYILVQFYIIRDDSIGMELQRHVLQARARGVRVYFSYDSFESKLSKQYQLTLKNAGVHIACYSPAIAGHSPLWHGFRNHRKLVVIDGREAFLGGLNVGDEYVERDLERVPWNDSHLGLQGPAVCAAQLIFVKDFFFLSETLPELHWEVKGEEKGSTVTIVATEPEHTRDTGTLVFATCMARARGRILLATPYFVPDEKGLLAIELAALRGVEVKILLPAQSDIALTSLLSNYYMARLLPLGVRFYQQARGDMHQKILMIDDDSALVGSANFDNRSFKLNFELSAWIQCPLAVGQVKSKLLSDFAASRETRIDDLQMGPLQHLKIAVARLLAPVL